MPPGLILLEWQRRRSGAVLLLSCRAHLCLVGPISKIHYTCREQGLCALKLAAVRASGCCALHFVDCRVHGTCCSGLAQRTGDNIVDALQRSFHAAALAIAACARPETT